MNQATKMKSKKWICLLFYLYILFIIKVIVFKYSFEQLNVIVDSWRKDVIWEGLSTANFTPFKTIRMYIRYYNMTGINSFANLFGNILVFIPFGYLLPMVHKSCKNGLILLANAFLFVVGIEFFQLFSAFGAFDVDDIILNCLGSMAGYGIFVLRSAFLKKKGRN